jgi:hypothetical protein
VRCGLPCVGSGLAAWHVLEARVGIEVAAVLTGELGMNARRGLVDCTIGALEVCDGRGGNREEEEDDGDEEQRGRGERREPRRRHGGGRGWMPRPAHAIVQRSVKQKVPCR